MEIFLCPGSQVLDSAETVLVRDKQLIRKSVAVHFKDNHKNHRECVYEHSSHSYSQCCNRDFISFWLVDLVKPAFPS